jgi:hypothetical protein
MLEKCPEKKLLRSSKRKNDSIRIRPLWDLQAATPTMRLTLVKCPALKRMGEQGKFNLPA